MTGTLKAYWQWYKRISPWTAMACYMATLVAWGVLFLEPRGSRALIAFTVIPVGIILDYLLHRWQTGRPNWKSALITSSIVTVLMPSLIPLYIPLLAVILAIASKHFLLLKKRHIFNPASTGIALTAVLFGYGLGWWPDSYVWLTVFFGLLNVWRVRKFPQILSFTAVYLILITAIGSFPSGGFFGFINLGQQTLPLALPWFFMLFMLPEPVTSLQPRGRQVEFGVVAALATFLASYVPIISPAALLWGLLTANLYARVRV